MIQRAFLALSLAILFLTTPQIALASLQTKSYSADRFDQAITIQENGAMLVKETVVFRFSGGPFTYVYRNLPITKTDGITIISASMDEQTLPQGTSSGQVEIIYDNPIKVTWHFAPTSDQVHTFVLTYLVQGVIQKASNADVLDWEALPTDYSYAIASSTIAVNYPEKATLVDNPQVVTGSAHIEKSAHSVVYSANNLQPDTLLEIGLHFQSGSLITIAPNWQLQQERTLALVPPYLLGGLAIFILGSLVLIVIYQRSRLRPTFAQLEEPATLLPPADLPAAIGGTLLSKVPNWNSALATLFDLAERGVVTISQTDEKKWYQTYPDFIIELQSQPPDLRPYETGLLDLLFQGKKGMVTSIKLSDVSINYARKAKQFNKIFKQEMLESGLYDPQQMRTRRLFGILSTVLVIVASVGITLVLALGLGPGLWPLIFPPAGLFAMSITAMVLFGMSSPLSEQGMVASSSWKAFSIALHNQLRNKEMPPSPDVFGNYLSYAASLGMAEKWVKYFQKQSIPVTIPPWFHALTSANGGDLSYFVMMVSATHSVGSGSGADGGAGGGAAGGGASGAG